MTETNPTHCWSNHHDFWRRRSVSRLDVAAGSGGLDEMQVLMEVFDRCTCTPYGDAGKIFYILYMYEDHCSNLWRMRVQGLCEVTCRSHLLLMKRLSYTVKMPCQPYMH